MKFYIAVVEFDEATEMFGAYFPDAPGATAMGATEEDVIRDATEALSEWVSDALSDGLILAEPRTYLQLLKSNEFGLGKGGMIARIPVIIETGKVVRANISIDAGLLTAIDEAAGKSGITRSAFLASAARDRIRHLEPQTGGA